MELGKLRTEGRNPRTMNMDEMPAEELLAVMNDEDRRCAEAVHEALPQIAKACDLCVESLKLGGRMIYTGAGTSGRLGILDASECGPTFSSDRVIACIAGGNEAVRHATEGSEDNEEAGGLDLQKAGLDERDTVIAIAASGRTPYAIGALKYARQAGARTVSVSCNKNALMSQYADAPIEVDAGPEVLTGSSRLKSGTCQKMILNMLSTCSMVRTGKVYENLMVDMTPSNVKLKDRALRIIAQAAGCDREQAQAAYAASGENMKTAIVMLKRGCSKEEAETRLLSAEGFVRRAISEE